MSPRTPTRPCPRCGAPVTWGPDAEFRPFCSERCKSLDFGAWIDESYRIPASSDANDDDTPPDDRD